MRFGFKEKNDVEKNNATVKPPLRLDSGAGGLR
jgi:hypothetical protein